MAGSRPSAEDKLRAMIEESVGRLFEERDRRSKEDSDPWARLEGMIDRSVSRQFEKLYEGVEEGKRRERKGGSSDDDDEGDGERPKLGILGL